MVDCRGASLVAAGSSGCLDLIGRRAGDQFRQGAPVSIGTLFVETLVENGEVLFSTNHTVGDHRVFHRQVGKPENFMGAAHPGRDRIICFCATNGLGFLPRVLVSRRTSN